jgi:hypothetical protein
MRHDFGGVEWHFVWRILGWKIEHMVGASYVRESKFEISLEALMSPCKKYKK